MLESEATMKSRAASDTHRDLSDRASELETPVAAGVQNQRLVQALTAAREEIATLREEIDKLCAPPSTYGVYLSVNEDGTVNVLSQGRKMKVNLASSIKAADIKPGQELILNDGLNVVEMAGYAGGP